MDLSALTIQQLRYLAAVDHHRSFREAARTCSVSQPALSSQVKKVEDLLGLCVFDRSRQPTVPTHRGARVVAQARVVLQQIDRLAAIAAHTEEPAGQYRLGIIPTLAATFLPLFLPGFTHKHPRVELDIQETKTDDMVRLLREGALDGGLAATPLDVPAIEERVICHEAFHVYLAPGHALLARDRLRQADLVGEHVLLLSEGHCFRTQVLHLCGLSPSSGALGASHVRFDGGSFDALIALVDVGFGVTILPELVVRGLPSERRIAQVRPFLAPAPAREISLLHSREEIRKDIGDALFDALHDSLPPDLRTREPGPPAVLHP